MVQNNIDISAFSCLKFYILQIEHPVIYKVNYLALDTNWLCVGSLHYDSFRETEYNWSFSNLLLLKYQYVDGSNPSTVQTKYDLNIQLGCIITLVCNLAREKASMI